MYTPPSSRTLCTPELVEIVPAEAAEAAVGAADDVPAVPAVTSDSSHSFDGGQDPDLTHLLGQRPRDRTRQCSDIHISLGRFDWDVSPKFKGAFSENYDRCTAFALKMRWLNAHPEATWVSYPGLKYHLDRARAVKSLRENTFGGIVCFGITGHPRDIVDILKLARNSSHLGSSRYKVARSFQPDGS
ncbi:hypothetical protein B0H10DRAFT_1941698 [Mycena sp. CBHHK59/15]|nr:hypothetical protein B0H10DRAFT_1941698 [Mycena sp. CBHHK59/15]